MLRPIANLTVNYEVEGRGHPVILLHGAGADLLTWDEVAPLLAKHANVWRYDQRGLGKTVRQGLPKLSLSVWTQDLLAFMDAMQIERAAIVGWSMGGAVALNFASLHPQRVTHLIPIGSPGPQQVVQDTSGFEKRQRMADAGATVEQIVEATFDFTKAAFSRWSRDNNPRAVENMRQTLLRNNVRDYSELVSALDGLSAFGPRLASVRAKTLVICGAEDARTPPALSQAIHEAIPGSSLRIMPDCGHFYGYEKPEELASLITEFLAADGLGTRGGP